jgi:ATP-binding protein involved in chromosome partitioning
MSGEFFGSGAGERLALENKVAYLGSVPLDANVRKGGDTGQPIVTSHPDSDAAIAFRELSQKVAARVSVITLSKNRNVIPIQMIN